MSRIKHKILLTVISILLICLRNFAQQNFEEPPVGDLIMPELNNIVFYGNSESRFTTLYRNLDTLAMKGKGTINIIHIGDSHIQAGFLPQIMRQQLAETFSGGVLGRGLIFPYKVAKTNGPPDYAVTFSGKWEHCRNVELTKSTNFGLTGFYIRTCDSISEISLHFREEFKGIDFNSVRILTGQENTSFSVDITNFSGNITKHVNGQKGTIELKLGQYCDSLHLRITRLDTLTKYFTWYGIDLENYDDEIVYHSMGVNGASVESFLESSMLENDLDLFRPDWVIISLGTNDASMTRFEGDKFESEYLQLIQRIRKAKPGVAILLTVPGDYYRKRRYDNKNIPELRNRIISVAQQSGCAVWDLYTLMGGSKSIMRWYSSGLVAKDKLHFTKAGYQLQGRLLFSAFMKSYFSHLENGQDQFER